MIMRTQIRTPNQINITKHAGIRAQQRGVQMAALISAALYGEVERAVGGSVRRKITLKATRLMERDGYSVKFIEKVKDTVVVTKEEPGERIVVTVGYKEKKHQNTSGFRKANPKNHRWNSPENI
jgi:hypothetical protein